MRHHLLALPLFLLAAVSALSILPPESAPNPLRIWQTTPGTNWNDSLLIGNGRLGAAIPGQVPQDVIHLNENSLWSGGPLSRVNPSAAAQMQTMQSYTQRGVIKQSEMIENVASLASYAYAGTPVSTQHYTITGDLTLAMDQSDTQTNYQRWLDLGDATTGVYYTIGNVSYEREMLSSEPLGMMAIRIASNTTGAVSFTIHLDRGESLNRWQDYSEPIGSDTTIMGGASGGLEAIEFAVGARVFASDGTVETLGDYVVCKNSTEAYVYIQSWTSYRKASPKQAVRDDLDGITNDYYSIRTAHVADYQKYAGRVSLNLGKSSPSQKKMTTEKRLAVMNARSFDPEITAMYFQYGRYMLICTSRDMDKSLPPNLQGLWNSDLDPSWGSKYTVDINLQMNYWPSLVTNLGDLTGPLWSVINSMKRTGANTARLMYNQSGIVGHHNTDLWGDTAPQDNYVSATFWPNGLLWLAAWIYEQYQYDGNMTFLQDNYETLQELFTFYDGFLTEWNGYRVTNPSLSPENEYFLPNTSIQEAITLGPTIDNSLLWELCGNLLDGMEALGMNNRSFQSGVMSMRQSLPPLKISYFGGIQEWIEDYLETQPGMRHFSPLYALYPGAQITSANATAWNAAKRTFKRRLSNGSGDTGWSRAWSISLAARAFDPEQVQNSTLEQLALYTYPTSFMDTGPPAAFQIDGNFGAPAGMAEALLQSHELVASANKTIASGHDLTPTYLGYSGPKTRLVRLLPALPHAWAQNGGGSVSGLRARGGFEVGMAWNDKGVLTSANITSMLAHTMWVTYGSAPVGPDAATTNMAGSKIKVNDGKAGRFVKVSTVEGETYEVTVA